MRNFFFGFRLITVVVGLSFDLKQSLYPKFWRFSQITTLTKKTMNVIFYSTVSTAS